VLTTGAGSFKHVLGCASNERCSDGGSANDYCSLNHDPLWLCSGIEFVRSAVKPNSAETCPVEAQRNCLGQQHAVEVAKVAHNATYMKRRDVRN
jgi:hypothetical protein